MVDRYTLGQTFFETRHRGCAYVLPCRSGSSAASVLCEDGMLILSKTVDTDSYGKSTSHYL